jgi:hypothetical protein
VNPAHLYIGDRADNGRDMAIRKRCPGRKGETNGNVVLNEAIVRDIRRSYKPRVITRKMLAEKHSISTHSIENVLYDRTSWEGIE